LPKQSSASNNLAASVSNTTINNELSKEFDPLSITSNVAKKPDQTSDPRFQKISRPQTPDSITEFSDHNHLHHHHQHHQQQQQQHLGQRLSTSNQDSYVSSSSQQQQPPKASLEPATAPQPSSSSTSFENLPQQQQQNVHFGQNPVQIQSQPPQPQQNIQAPPQTQQFHSQFNPQQLQQQQQVPPPPPQVHQQPPQPSQNQYYVNPTALKAPVPNMPPQQISGQPQHPALASQPPSYMPPLPQLSNLGQQQPQQQQQFNQPPQQQQQFYGQSAAFQHQPPPQQQQQQQYPGMGQTGPVPQYPPVGPGGVSAANSNPYAKMPGQSLARPPSATLYQQGYK
jgi:hypothetical protein